jgi:excisionase family DNA binding protein
MKDEFDVAVQAAVEALVAALRAAVRADATSIATAPDRLLSVDQASVVLGIGRSRLYNELGAGRLRSLRVGRRRLIPANGIAEYIASRNTG